MKNLLLITIILCSHWVFGQDKTTHSFSGNFEGGTATYSYYEDDNYERIYNGKFAYSTSAEKYEGLKINTNGSFSENLREGKWVFSIKNIKSPVSRIISSKEKAVFQYMLSMSSYTDLTQKEIQAIQKVVSSGSLAEFQTYSSTLSGNYIAGKLNGDWTFNEISTGGKEPELTNEKNLPINSSVSFKDNHLIGNFTYKRDEKNYVSGQFNNNGAINGTWTIKWSSKGNEFENISEYQNGLLIKLLERNISTGEILFRDIQNEYNGKAKMAEAILFWLKNDEIEFIQLPISKRNYMYKLEKGIIKPDFEYNF